MVAASLFAFHLQVGVRVALRMLSPILAAAAAVAVLYGSPAVVVAPFVALLFPPAPSLTAGLLATVLSTALAAFALRRLSLGLRGWIRHLPADGVAHRRALTAGLVAAQAPLLVLLGGTGIVAWSAAPGPSLVRLIGVVPCAWGSCLAVLQVQRGGARLLAVAAAVGAFSGALPVLGAALALLAVAEITAGPFQGVVTGRAPVEHQGDPVGTARAPKRCLGRAPADGHDVLAGTALAGLRGLVPGGARPAAGGVVRAQQRASTRSPRGRGTPRRGHGGGVGHRLARRPPGDAATAVALGSLAAVVGTDTGRP